MTKKFKRTNKTNLSDNELVIFDVLFDGELPFNALMDNNNFSLHFNLSSHNFSNAQFKKIINKFVKDNLMYVYFNVDSSADEIFIGLTEKGGFFWEKERTPLWDKYIMDLSSENNDVWELSIYSQSLKVAEDFIKTSHECKLYELEDPSNLKVQKIDKKHFNHIPWKQFPVLYNIKSRLSEKMYTEKEPEMDWQLYRCERNWWRGLSELQSLF